MLDNEKSRAKCFILFYPSLGQKTPYKKFITALRVPELDFFCLVNGQGTEVREFCSSKYPLLGVPK